MKSCSGCWPPFFPKLKSFSLALPPRLREALRRSKVKLLAVRGCGGWVGLLFLFTSCSNELDLLDDWKETTVVYGLLDKSDSVHYLKIYKAYLGEGNALQMAQNYDSINYANQLNVQVERWLNNALAETYILKKDTGIPKDPGIFAAPGQACYRMGEPLDENSEYRLIITNSSTGNVVKAHTKLIKNFSTPGSGGTFAVSNPKGRQTVTWFSAENGRLYQLIIRFHYDEVQLPLGVITPKYADWVFPSQKSFSTAGGEEMTVKFNNSDFYSFVKSVVPPKENVVRYARNKKIEYLFSVAAEELSTYMEIYQPSAGIVQEKPEYTNIENGLGIFSSRFNLIVTKDSLSKPSADYLRDSLLLGFN